MSEEQTACEAQTAPALSRIADKIEANSGHLNDCIDRLTALADETFGIEPPKPTLGQGMENKIERLREVPSGKISNIEAELLHQKELLLKLDVIIRRFNTL